MADMMKINPFLNNGQVTPINFGLGAQGTPKVNPFTPTEGTPKVGGGQALAGFNPQKWQAGMSGLPTGALGEDGAVYGKLRGGQETRLGGRLNVDAFSVC